MQMRARTLARSKRHRQRHRSVKASRRSRKALGEVVASRRFLVDVHLLRN